MKDAPTVVTLDVNAYNRRSQDSSQYTNMNNDDMVEAGNKTELICTQVTLLLKVPERNKARNATRKLLQEFLVQIQQSDRNVTFLLWYYSKNNSSALTIERPINVSKDFQALQTYYPCMNPKQHTKQQPNYTSIFLCHSDNIKHMQKDMSSWFENGGHKLYKKPLHSEKTIEVDWLE